jgi:prepilin-type N-terminal cleavage/methylation domain-containing protein
MNLSLFSKKPSDSGKAGARAFTLIELLVVIAIIAILAALVLAGAFAARANGRGPSSA